MKLFFITLIFVWYTQMMINECDEKVWRDRGPGGTKEIYLVEKWFGFFWGWHKLVKVREKMDKCGWGRGLGGLEYYDKLIATIYKDYSVVKWKFSLIFSLSLPLRNILLDIKARNRDAFIVVFIQQFCELEIKSKSSERFCRNLICFLTRIGK